MNLPPDYDERVYAGWLGKCIGVRFGAPLENWTYEDIRDNLGEVTAYLREDAGKIFKPDDDTSVPMILIRALEGLKPGEPLTPQHVADALLNGIGDGHGSFWWGGYGVSTEHTAYMNLAAGIPAPQSGSIAQNGAALAEQIGGQIFSDIWGLVAPNDPARAAGMAAVASSVTHDGEGINGGRFIAALVSAAFLRARSPQTHPNRPQPHSIRQRIRARRQRRVRLPRARTHPTGARRSRISRPISATTVIPASSTSSPTPASSSSACFTVPAIFRAPFKSPICAAGTPTATSVTSARLWA